ncbi:GPW/gp25 family protein [Mesorhizobium sp. Cs1299R1N3]|uniref:GPW/gp25 family protein n=1 Tax=Mesorhizobium sp. Cs1299R1N3 TaxID=3015173 RepID=UPI00301D50B9
MSSLGVDRQTGGILTGWEHVKQSIEVILTTPIGSRVMRRDFGSRLMSLIDAPMNDRVVLAAYSAVADALAKWEPRYRLETVNIDAAGASGAITFLLSGTYYPRGHLGDFSDGSARLAEITF